eukprot:361917-Chlamydomonas_euryale.AAC.1
MDGKPRNEVERWVQDARANTLDSTLDAAALEAAQTASRTVAALRDQGAAGSSGTHGGAPPGAPQLINTSGGLRGVLESLQVLALALLLRLFSSMCTGSCSVRDGMLAWLHERLREVKVGDTELLPNFQSESQREAIKVRMGRRACQRPGRGEVCFLLRGNGSRRFRNCVFVRGGLGFGGALRALVLIFCCILFSNVCVGTLRAPQHPLAYAA